MSMKFMRTTIFSIGFLFVLPLSAEGIKSAEKGHFLSVNPNIKNKELINELEKLKQGFDFERQTIQDYYTKEIERMQEERRSEIKTLKKQFAGKRETILKKYGENRKLNHSKPTEAHPSDKKPIRKPK